MVGERGEIGGKVWVRFGVELRELGWRFRVEMRSGDGDRGRGICDYVILAPSKPASRPYNRQNNPNHAIQSSLQIQSSPTTPSKPLD